MHWNNKNLSTLLLFTLLPSIAQSKPLPDIYCRQGFITANVEKKTNFRDQTTAVDNYLREIDKNIYLEHDVSHWAYINKDHFQIKVIPLQVLSKTTVQQELANGWESRLILRKEVDEAPDCFDFQQVTLSKNKITKTKKTIKTTIAGDTMRSCMTNVPEGQTVFSDRSYVSSQSNKNPETMYPYTICAVGIEY